MNNLDRSIPIPETASVPVLRLICLAIQQAGMYGINHNVAQLAIQEAFARLESTLALHGAIEFAVSNGELLVNGALLSSKDGSIANMVSRIEQHKLGGILILSAIDLEDFATFIRLMSTPPAALANLGGLRQALEDIGLHSIQIIATEYRKVPEGEPEMISASPENKVFSLDGAPGGVHDLSAELKGSSPFAAPFAASHDAGSEAQEALKRRRRENTQKMASLLRDTAALLESSGTLPPEIQHKQILTAIERILKLLESTSAETRKHINHLAGKVEADRQTIASIESAARRRGIGFNLTRKELLGQYAEINQEFLQPVTVSAGALDLLLSGRCGKLSASQQELVRLAFEGMERVNQLIAYTNRISGLPESLHPNADVIRDSYGNSEE